MIYLKQKTIQNKIKLLNKKELEIQNKNELNKTLNELYEKEKNINIKSQSLIERENEIFNHLTFPLQDVKKKIIQKNNYLMNQTNKVSIKDCFVFNQQKMEYSNKNKKYYCSICKQYSIAIDTTKIYVSPTILILILNRGKYNIYDIKIDFTETIDISEYVIKKDIPQMTYNLYGVINYIGQSG